MNRGFCSKKAAFNWLVALLGTVIVGIPLLALGYTMLHNAEESYMDMKCHLSIVAADKASTIKRVSADTFDMVPNLDCKAKEVILEPDDVRRTRGGRIDDDLVKEEIAEVMYGCARTVDFPHLNPYQGAWPDKDKTFCMICSTIEFTDDFVSEANEQEYSLEKLSYWFATRYPEGQKSGERKTYYEYISGVRPSIEETLNMKEQNDFYALHNKYYVVWRFDREDKKATGLLFFIPVAGPALGAGTVLFGFITGEYASIEDIRKAGNVVVSQGIYLLPESVLSGKLSGSSGTKDTCTVLVN